MLEAFLNIFRIADLRKKLLFTFGALVIYRIGFWIPLPAIDAEAIAEAARKAQEGGSGFGNLMTYMNMFTGGSLGQSTIFGLGIMPYISAAIIMQLLGTTVPTLQALKKEGPAGQQKIQEYTRYLTVALCLVQSSVWLGTVQAQQLVYPQFHGTITFWMCGIIGLTAGSVFLMWLGEQIDRFGIGNGASLIITAGIVVYMPQAIMMIAGDFSVAGDGGAKYSIDDVVFLLSTFVIVTAGAVVITQGQRRIPIQQAKHTRGRRVYGGQRTYLPLRVNHGGVMPIIFASAILMFPLMLVNWLAGQMPNDFTIWLAENFGMESFLYVLVYILFIYFFAYFWTTVQFQPKEMATQLRDHGSNIPGMRPGPRTAEYLENVMERITYCGAGFLSLIAIVPTIVSVQFEVNFMVTQFLGGTGLLIAVSVMLDFVQRVEAQLMMRNYEGFLSGGGGGQRIRGSRS
ncbi:MAG: preprotein translocase subunit SecY [Phycisphaeraceae bacterium]|nr:preprotein translocase subunit SecY [Phycisphaeraceae bacterium]